MTTDERRKLIQKLLDAGLKANQKDSTARLLRKWQNYKKKQREEDSQRSALLVTRNERNRRKRFRRAQRGKR